ncbi:TonB-dependent receptor, partial [Sphingomonas bacterium]|uniref:TonB-dependent receptor n=1 Tax=Sphingomonas bacterium TaxID=1895847 RepID=UPI001C2DEB64
GFRIVAAPPPFPPRIARPTLRPAPSSPAMPPPAEVVVTASKQPVPLIRYPGTITRRTGSPLLPDGSAPAPSDLARLLPVLQTTALGPGRDKLFIRGIADSSFNGTTLSTVSVYLDDVQLSASGPDPGLRLYDMAAEEVMEGPQGTLYGAGSIGGVVRLTSNAPDLVTAGAAVQAGATALTGGAPGGDLATTINLPVVAGRLGLRGVGYLVRDGGYIDDTARGASNVNRTDIAGGRLAGRLLPGDGWRVDASGALQWIHSRDGQYALAGEGTLARRDPLAQPFTGAFRFGRLVINKQWPSGLELTSATGLAAFDTSELFDMTPPGVRPVSTSRADTEKLLASHEMRLSRVLPGGRSWLVGVTLVSDRSVLERSAGVLGMERDVTGVRNLTRAASAFGEATQTFWTRLSITLGGRYTIARVDSEPSQIQRAMPYVKGQRTLRLDPTMAASLRLSTDLALFARHQTGFRTGGLAVARGVGRVANYDPDTISVNEIGLRRLPRSPHALGLTFSASRAHWANIQADLFSRRGQPFTINLGNAEVTALEASLDWAPWRGLTLSGSALYTDNHVTGPIADQSRPDNRRLPDTPPVGGHADLGYRWGGALAPHVGANVTVVGRSVLGTGDLLDVRQGGYALFGAGAGVQRGRVGMTLDLDNLLNAAPDRFAFGNPFGLAARDQRTPARPRSLRIGIASRW